MKILNLTIKLLALSLAIAFTSCSDDEDPIPVVSFEKTSYSIAENKTSALQVKVQLDIPARVATTVNYSVAGTAVAGENYSELTNKSVTFEQGESEAVIFINPMNVSLIEDDKIVVLALTGGDFVNIDNSNAETSITILDNKTASSDAPKVSFNQTQYITNAYMQDEIVVTVTIDKALSTDVNIPLTINGDAVSETNYTIEGLETNNELVLKQGEVSVDFKVIIKNTNELNIDKNINIEFATPVITDYAISTANNTLSVNIIDPEFINIWFLDKQSMSDQTGNEAILQQKDAEGNVIYTDGKPVSGVVDGIYMPEVDRKNGDSWTDLGPNPRVYADPANANIWKGDFTYSYRYGKEGDYIYYKSYACNNYDIKDFFPSGYLANYNNETLYKVDTYLRFAPTVKDGSEGKVYIPEQTITTYKIKEGYEWKGKTEVVGFGEQYNYKIDGNETNGDLSASSNVTPITITVLGEGTFNNKTKLIEFKVKFTCDDPNFTADEIEYRIYPLRGDEPVL